MFRTLNTLWLPVGALLVCSQLCAATPKLGPASLVPGNAIIVLQVTKPKELIGHAFDDQVVSLVQALPPYQEAMAKPDTQQALGLVRFFENKYDMKLPELLSTLMGGGITLAVLPGEQHLLVVESEDAKMLSEIHEFFRTIAEGEAAKAGNAGRVKSAEYRGVTGWSFGPNESHAIVGKYLLLADKPEALKAALDLQAAQKDQADEGGECIGAQPRFVHSQQALSDKAQIAAYADMRILKQLPGFRQALEGKENPLARLLFAPLLAGANQATWLAAGVEIGASQVNIEVLADKTEGADSPLDSFAIPATSADGAMPNLVVPRQIAGLSFYRDLHRFYASKDELFGERTSGLIFFENMMGIFFSGKDLTEEVLAETLPSVRFVVAEQQYDQKTGTPAMQLPGFAAVIKLKDPEDFQLVVKEAWQKAIGLVNFTRGQKALPGLIIDTATHEGISYTTAFFSVADEADQGAVDVRFNFQPALAVAGDYLIMSSTDALACDLIDAVKKESQEKTAAVAGEHSLALVNAAPLASILQANSDAMVRQSMVEKGKSRAEAEQEVQGLLTALKYLDDVRWRREIKKE